MQELNTMIDTLNARIGVLTRRETEARILAPLIDALSDTFGREQVLEVVRKTIIKIAEEQGCELAVGMGGDSLKHFQASLQYWTQNQALEIDLLEENDETLSFNVTRCRYAEMYRALGIPELGAVLSCDRDFALIDGFNENVNLERTQTIMGGADYCDFRYKVSKQPIELE